MKQVSLITDHKQNREYVAEFILLATVLALAINLGSTFVSDALGSTTTGWLGLGLCVGGLLVATYIRPGSLRVR